MVDVTVSLACSLPASFACACGGTVFFVAGVGIDVCFFCLGCGIISTGGGSSIPAEGLNSSLVFRSCTLFLL